MSNAMADKPTPEPDEQPTTAKKRTSRKKAPAVPREREYVKPSSMVIARDVVMVGNPNALVPTNLYDASQLSKELSKAAQSVGDLREKPAEIMFRIVQGSELGLGPCASIRHIYTVHGKVGLEAVVLEALARGSQRCALLRQVEVPDDEHVASTWLCVRSDEADFAWVARWTVGDHGKWMPDKYLSDRFPNLRALRERGGYRGIDAMGRRVHAKGGQIPMARKSNWIGNEALMVRKRAATDVIRSALPDVVLGINSTENLRDDADPTDVVDADVLDHSVHPLGDVAEHDMGIVDG